MDSRTEITGEKMDELLPCPFCGGVAHIRRSTDQDGDFSAIQCFCGVDAFYSSADDQSDADALAVRQWNRRASSPARSAEDWTVSASETARAVLDYLGIGSDGSLEPGADRRRDNVAKIITRYFDRQVAARSAEGMVTDEMVETALHYAEYVPNNANRKWMRSALEAALSLSAQPGTEEGAGEPVAWRCYDTAMGTWSVTDSAELVRSRSRRPEDWIIAPLFSTDDPSLWRFWNDKARSLASRVQELEKALRDIREKASQGMSHGLTAADTCEDIRDIADATLTAKEA